MLECEYWTSSKVDGLKTLFSKLMGFRIIRGLVSMVSAEPINFERMVLKPINFWENRIETHILTPNDAKTRQFSSSKKALNPSTEIHDGVPDHSVKIDGFCQLGMSFTYAFTLWMHFVIKDGRARFLLDSLWFLINAFLPVSNLLSNCG